MRFDLNITVSSLDLSQALQGQEGTFLAQQGGQNYYVTARRGHSITSLRPVGPRTPQMSSGTSAEPWLITKISNQVIDLQQTEDREQAGRQN